MGHVMEMPDHGAGGHGIKLFGKKLPTPLLLIGGGGVLLLFLAVRGKRSTGSTTSQQGVQGMPTPPGGAGSDFGFTGFDPATGIPIPATPGGFGDPHAVDNFGPSTVPGEPPSTSHDVATEPHQTVDIVVSGGLTSTPPVPPPTVPTAVPGLSQAQVQALIASSLAKYQLAHAAPTAHHHTQTGLESLSHRPSASPLSRPGMTPERVKGVMPGLKAVIAGMPKQGSKAAEVGAHNAPHVEEKPHPVLGVPIPPAHNHVGAPKPKAPPKPKPQPKKKALPARGKIGPRTV